MKTFSFEYEDMPGKYGDILVLAHRLHAKMVPHELSMTIHNGWAIEIYPVGSTPLDERKFVLIQDDSSIKNNSHEIEFITEDNGNITTETLDDDECFERIWEWWKNEYESRTNNA